MMRRRSSGARAIAIVVVCAACAIPRTLRWAAPERRPASGDYGAIRRAWTRDESVVAVSGFENVLTLTATCMAPEFRAAYASRYAHDYQLGPRERADLARAQATAVAREIQFFVTAYSGTDFDDADLSDPDRGWRLLLVTPRGRWAPTSLSKVTHPTAVQKAYFPRTSRQRIAFLVGFPPVVDDQDPWFRLVVIGPRGHGELQWNLGD